MNRLQSLLFFDILIYKLQLTDRPKNIFYLETKTALRCINIIDFSNYYNNLDILL